MNININLKKQKTNRFIELDLLRGIAISLMIFGHILWDLEYFNLLNMDKTLYSTLQKIVPQLFFLLVGMSLIISIKRKTFESQKEENKYLKHIIKRGIKIFSLGMIITALSLFLIPNRPVIFGVLHCIGLSIIISTIFLKYRKHNLIFATILIYIGMIINQTTISNPTFLHFITGFRIEGIWQITIDYFPLLPWFGICILGISIGDLLYCGDKRMFKIPDLSKYRPAKILSWIGQHSLLIYLLHQPIIAGFVLILNNI